MSFSFLLPRPPHPLQRYPSFPTCGLSVSCCFWTSLSPSRHTYQTNSVLRWALTFRMLPLRPRWSHSRVRHPSAPSHSLAPTAPFYLATSHVHAHLFQAVFIWPPLLTSDLRWKWNVTILARIRHLTFPCVFTLLINLFFMTQTEKKQPCLVLAT